jgi:hypothetical protein
MVTKNHIINTNKGLVLFFNVFDLVVNNKHIDRISPL